MMESEAPGCSGEDRPCELGVLADVSIALERTLKEGCLPPEVLPWKTLAKGKESGLEKQHLACGFFHDRECHHREFTVSSAWQWLVENVYFSSTRSFGVSYINCKASIHGIPEITWMPAKGHCVLCMLAAFCTDPCANASVMSRLAKLFHALHPDYAVQVGMCHLLRHVLIFGWSSKPTGLAQPVAEFYPDLKLERGPICFDGELGCSGSGRRCMGFIHYLQPAAGGVYRHLINPQFQFKQRGCTIGDLRNSLIEADIDLPNIQFTTVAAYLGIPTAGELHDPRGAGMQVVGAVAPQKMGALFTKWIGLKHSVQFPPNFAISDERAREAIANSPEEERLAFARFLVDSGFAVTPQGVIEQVRQPVLSLALRCDSIPQSLGSTDWTIPNPFLGGVPLPRRRKEVIGNVGLRKSQSS